MGLSIIGRKYYHFFKYSSLDCVLSASVSHIEITTVMIAACAPVSPILTRYLNDKYKQRSRFQTTDGRAEIEHQRVNQDIYDSTSDRTKCAAPGQRLKTLDLKFGNA